MDGAVISRHNTSILVNVTPSNGVRVRITKTNITDPVHNISITPVELFGRSYPEYPFHPGFIDEIKGTTMLRFSGWLRVDNNDYNSENMPRDWSRRTTTENQTQNCLAGVALEYMIALSNILAASPWFGLPKASGPDDPYITQFAGMVRDNLDPNLIIYIEYRDNGASCVARIQATLTSNLMT